MKKTKVKRGQLWVHRRPGREKDFYARIFAEGRGNKWRAHCSDGNTHAINEITLWQKYELVDEKAEKVDSAP